MGLIRVLPMLGLRRLAAEWQTLDARRAAIPPAPPDLPEGAEWCIGVNMWLQCEQLRRFLVQKTVRVLVALAALTVTAVQVVQQAIVFARTGEWRGLILPDSSSPSVVALGVTLTVAVLPLARMLKSAEETYASYQYRRWLRAEVAAGRRVARQTVPISCSAQRLFDLLEAVFPRRITGEELGDALEQLHRLEAAGASRWKCRTLVGKTVFWLAWNVIKEASPLIALLAKLFGGH